MTAPEAARRAYHQAVAGAIGVQPGKTINWPVLDHALDAAFAAAADATARLTERALQAEQAALIAAHNERERIRQLAAAGNAAEIHVPRCQCGDLAHTIAFADLIGDPQ